MHNFLNDVTIKSILNQFVVGPPVVELTIPRMGYTKPPSPIRGWRSAHITGLREEKRLNFDADVLVEFQGELWRGRSRDLSMSGIFLQLRRHLLKAGDEVELTIIPRRARRSYQVKAQVVRVANSATEQPGYGLLFTNLNEVN